VSIVLKALERAQAQRSNDPLRAQPAQAPVPRHAPRWLWLLLGFVAAALLGAAAVGWLGHADSAQPTMGSKPQAVTSAAAQVAQIASQPKPTPVAQSVPAAASPSASVVARAVAASASPAVVRTPSSAPNPAASAPKFTATASVAPDAMASAPVASAPPASTPPASDEITPLAQLSASARAALPALAIGGIMYSEAPGQRMAIVNGQVVQEGNKLGDAEVVRIEPNALVIRSQGQRIRVPAP
jgi:general secretion pathway protein B